MTSPTLAAPRPIRIGISACLLGGCVRFRGHKREAMRLVRIEDHVRLLTVKTGVDLTERMERFARPRLSAPAGEHLSGYMLRKTRPPANSSG